MTFLRRPSSQMTTLLWRKILKHHPLTKAGIKVCQWYARVCTLGTLLVQFWYTFCQKCTQTVPCMVHFWYTFGTFFVKSVPKLYHMHLCGNDLERMSRAQSLQRHLIPQTKKLGKWVIRCTCQNSGSGTSEAIP